MAPVAGATAGIPENLARPTRPSRRVAMPADAPAVLTLMTEYANADLFDTSKEKRLPGRERWRCVRGNNFAVFDQSRLLDTEDFGQAFGNYTQLYKKMLGPFALPDGYNVDVLAMDKQDSDWMRLPPFISTVLSRPGDASYNHMIVLVGYIRYVYQPSFGSVHYGGAGYGHGWGWGGFSPARWDYHDRGFVNHHDGFGYNHQGADYWHGGYGGGFYHSYSYERVPVSTRDWATDLQNASRDYNYAVVAQNRKFSGHVLKAGLDQLLQMQRINKEGLTSSIFNYTAFTTKGERQYETIPLKDLFSRANTTAATYSQRRSTAFVMAHMCLGTFENSHRRGDAYLAFLSKTTGVRNIAEQMFQECFGIGYAEMDALLAAHAESLRKTPKTWSLSFTFKQPPQAAKKDWATDAEVGRMKARLFMQAAAQIQKDINDVERGTPSSRFRKESVERTYGSWKKYVKTRDEHIGDARREILARFKRGTADARLLEVAGDWEFAYGDPGRGRRYYTLAARAGVDSSNVYLSLVKWMLEDQKKQAGARLDSKATMSALALIKKGMDAAPLRKEFFDQLVMVFENSAINFPVEAEDAFVRTAIRFRYEHDLIYRMANLVARRGSRVCARKLVDIGLKSTYAPEVLARFNRISTASAPVPASAETGDGGRDSRIAGEDWVVSED